ncbi:MAG: sulfatase-like hydrolase/transferase [Planctomycetota bacterium]|jgi:arylsulfatase A-like enzyme|nr:sulfatase-like hydrolase/transferase [Planctomycetota bacterium]
MSRPNILILMADQLIGRVINPDAPVYTPHFDALCRRGTRIQHAYSANPVCSPSRASMMCGLLPHNHGVLCVTHTADKDQNVLREQHPHFAQRLQAAGYRTSYVGKWHVEHSEQPERFGWDRVARRGDAHWQAVVDQIPAGEGLTDTVFYVDGPEGYQRTLLYGVTSEPLERRMAGVVAQVGLDFLDDHLAGEQPWCLMLSTLEPHDPFVCGQAAYHRYDPDRLAIPDNWADTCADKPALYRKAGRTYQGMSERQRREALACYYASTTEIDQAYGRVLERLEAAGQLDNTIVILTSDHGDLLGAHGLYCKNIGGFEECYEIPMVLAGPGIAAGASPDARVGIHDLAPTICELAGAETINNTDSRSFCSLLTDPSCAPQFQTGFAESCGGRILLTQRVYWDGPWKLVLNGFDDDELYHLGDDPGEVSNRIDDPSLNKIRDQLYAGAWSRIRDTGDHGLVKSHYPALRVFGQGPLAADRCASASG